LAEVWCKFFAEKDLLAQDFLMVMGDVSYIEDTYLLRESDSDLDIFETTTMVGVAVIFIIIVVVILT